MMMEIGVQCELGIECLKAVLNDSKGKFNGISPGENVRKCRNRVDRFTSNVDSIENEALLSKASKKLHKYKKIKKRWEAVQAENKKLIARLALIDAPAADVALSAQQTGTCPPTPLFPNIEQNENQLSNGDDSIALYDIEEIQPFVKSYLARQTKKPIRDGNLSKVPSDTATFESPQLADAGTSAMQTPQAHHTVYIEHNNLLGTDNILRLENELEDADDIDIINDDDSDEFINGDDDDDDDYDDYDEQMHAEYQKRVIKQENELIIEDTMQIENDLFCCNMCDGLFESINELDLHMRSHGIHVNSTIDSNKVMLLTDTVSVHVNNAYIDGEQPNLNVKIPPAATAATGKPDKLQVKTKKSVKKTADKTAVKKTAGKVPAKKSADKGSAKKRTRKTPAKKTTGSVPASTPVAVTSETVTTTTPAATTAITNQSTRKSSDTVNTIESLKLHENKDGHRNPLPYLHSDQKLYNDRDRSRSNQRTESRSDSTSSRCSNSRERYSHSERETSPLLAQERRILFIGDIDRDTSRHELYQIFGNYGPIRSITMHNNRYVPENSKPLSYAFVTFENAGDAFKVYDRRMADPFLKDFNISFGGRRAFCKMEYRDLDNIESVTSSNQAAPNKWTYSQQKPKTQDSFEMLLKSVKQTLDKRKEMDKLTV